MLLLAACGGGDDDDSANDAPNDATATEATDNGDDGGDGGDGDEETGGPEDTAAPEETDSGGGSGSDFHACDALTKEEISAVVGYEVIDGVDYLAVSPQATQCEYGPGVYVEILTEGGPEFYEAVHFGQDVEPVDGVGDEAVWNDGIFEAIEGDNYVAVQLIGFGFGNPGSTEQDEIDAAAELARMALENIP
jgi:hypothetical protein